MLVKESLTENNVKKVADLEYECFGKDAWSENLLRQEIGQEDKHYIVLFSDGELAAYGGFSQVLNEGDIMNIAVAEKFRRQGYGKRILEEIFSIAKDLHIERITLEVRESNLPARSLYEKEGFVFSGIRRNYYRNKENCCIYWKVIAEDVTD